MDVLLFLLILAVLIIQINNGSKLSSRLQKGKHYTMRFGKDLRMPAYDLYNFRTSIPEELPALQIRNIKPVVKETKEIGTPTFFTSRRMIWAALILVIALLGFITLRMVRER
jgi:hypothetical protein